MLSEPIQVTLKVIAKDINLAKLEWFRIGGETSERQWRDILGVMDLQGDRLDLNYLQKWAMKFGIQDLLLRAIQSVKGKEKDA